MAIDTVFCNGVPCYLVNGESTFNVPSIRASEPITVHNVGTTTCTLIPASGETIGGASSVILYEGMDCTLHPNTQNWLFMTTNFSKIVPEVFSVGAFGYSELSGGSVTQTGSITSAVTLNKPCGKITLVSHNFSNNDVQSFTFNNSNIGANDVVLFSIISNGTDTTKLNIQASAILSGSCVIAVQNVQNVATGAVALEFNFTVIKGDS